MKYATMGYLVCGKGILMLKKSERVDDPNSGFCTLPGGKLEPFEKGLKNLDGRVKSVIREVEDETGISIINPVLRGVVLFDNKDRTFPNWPNPDNFIVNVYYATKYNGELTESDEGVPFWAKDLEEAISFPSNAGDKFVYEWLKDGRHFFGVVKHNGNEVDESGTWVDFY